MNNREEVVGKKSPEPRKMHASMQEANLRLLWVGPSTALTKGNPTREASKENTVTGSKIQNRERGKTTNR
jgi:hypothetical protein